MLLCVRLARVSASTAFVGGLTLLNSFQAALHVTMVFAFIIIPLVGYLAFSPDDFWITDAVTAFSMVVALLLCIVLWVAFGFLILKMMHVSATLLKEVADQQQQEQHQQELQQHGVSRESRLYTVSQNKDSAKLPSGVMGVGMERDVPSYIQPVCQERYSPSGSGAGAAGSGAAAGACVGLPAPPVMNFVEMPNTIESAWQQQQQAATVSSVAAPPSPHNSSSPTHTHLQYGTIAGTGAGATGGGGGGNASPTTPCHYRFPSTAVVHFVEVASAGSSSSPTPTAAQRSPAVAASSASAPIAVAASAKVAPSHTDRATPAPPPAAAATDLVVVSYNSVSMSAHAHHRASASASASTRAARGPVVPSPILSDSELASSHELLPAAAAMLVHQQLMDHQLEKERKLRAGGAGAVAGAPVVGFGSPPSMMSPLTSSTSVLSLHRQQRHYQQPFDDAVLQLQQEAQLPPQLQQQQQAQRKSSTASSSSQTSGGPRRLPFARILSV